VAELVSKFRELRGILADLKERGLAGIVDALMPANNDECSVLREAAMLVLPDLQGVADLFDALKTHVTQPEMPEQGNFVRVMSLHKSKGLTSKVAIIAGCIHGLIPFVDADQSPKEQAAILAEQRRLFYVAITRCTEILVLSSVIRLDRKLAWKIGAQVKRGPSSVGATIASRFIHELGPSAPVPFSGQQWKARKYMP
jgi:superfamily I DNA/RNA helicase